jgi:hypothetical protein
VSDLAKQIVDEATDQERATNEGMPEPPDEGGDPAVVSLVRRAWSKGRPERAAELER